MPPAFTVRTACPACGSPSARSLLAVPYDDPDLRRAMERLYAEIGRYDHARVSGAVYELRQCAGCRLVYQAQIPGDALSDEIYNAWHDPAKTRAHWLDRVDVERRLEIAREVAVAANLAARRQAPLRLLDYGCGMGLWAGMARAFGADVTGVEFSAARREHCAGLGIRMCAPAELPADAFDYIQLDQVLEHLAEPAPLLRDLATRLRPGGVICVAVPSGRGVPRALPRWRREFARPALGRLVAVVPLLHLNAFTQSSLLRLAASCGLAHLRPGWSALRPLWGRAAGLRGQLRCLARPFQFRSRWTTRLYFQRPAS